jgi:pimeloyl-ACP methyl ester carboxylesterase
MRTMFRSRLPLVFLALASQWHHAIAEQDSPVSSIPAQAFRIQASSGAVAIPYESSQSLSRPLPGITRAVIVVHGLKRNVESEFRTATRAASMAGAEGRETLLLAPQFLNETDLTAHALPAEVLRWRGSSWESGQPAVAPAPVSSFEVLDALIAHLCDRAIFPNLRTIVVAGHSAGGQIVQRYAVVGNAEQLAGAQGIHVRFVVANPSSYIYFSDDRPIFAKSGPIQFAPFRSPGCPDFNHWKYGPAMPPTYVALAAAANWQETEDGFAKRDVVYLLGTADNDPDHPELDKSCAGEAEGPMRFARGQAYFAYLHARHPSDWNQRLRFVPHVAHSADEMFTSQCGIASIFDHGKCPDQ